MYWVTKVLAHVLRTEISPCISWMSSSLDSRSIWGHVSCHAWVLAKHAGSGSHALWRRSRPWPSQCPCRQPRSCRLWSVSIVGHIEAGTGRHSRPSSSRTWYREATSSSAMLPNCQPSGAFAARSPGSSGDTRCKQYPVVGPEVGITEIQSRDEGRATTRIVSRRADTETRGPEEASEQCGMGSGESWSWRRSQARPRAGRARQETQQVFGGLAASSEGACDGVQAGGVCEWSHYDVPIKLGGARCAGCPGERSQAAESGRGLAPVQGKASRMLPAFGGASTT